MLMKSKQFCFPGEALIDLPTFLYQVSRVRNLNNANKNCICMLCFQYPSWRSLDVKAFSKFILQPQTKGCQYETEPVKRLVEIMSSE